MRREWRVGSGRQRYIILRWLDAREEERARAVRGRVGLDLDRWFPTTIGDECFTRPLLLDLFREVEMGDPSRRPTAWLKERVRSALYDGRLLAIRIETAPLPAAAATVKEESPAPQSVTREPRRRLELERLYHDNAPLHRAPYTLTFSDGTTIRGELDDNGRAVIDSVPDLDVTVEYGPDARPYRRVDDTPNPDFAETFTAEDIDALVLARQGDS